jgi:hypothetical protein|tara:strand:- start:187 stop:444 length:258 start_codon:yes stop_codon:yes gene_type:complete
MTMSNESDYDAWLEGISDFHTAFDDAWSRMFVMILGTELPSSKVRAKFRDFVSDRCMEAVGRLECSENDVINLLPEFLDSLVGED